MNTKRRIAAFLSVMMIVMSLPWDVVAVYASQDIITDDPVIISDEESGAQDKVITDNAVVVADDTGDIIVCPDSDDVLTDNKTSDDDNIIVSNDEPYTDGDIAVALVCTQIDGVFIPYVVLQIACASCSLSWQCPFLYCREVIGVGIAACRDGDTKMLSPIFV